MTLRSIVSIATAVAIVVAAMADRSPVATEALPGTSMLQRSFERAGKAVVSEEHPAIILEEDDEEMTNGMALLDKGSSRTSISMELVEDDMDVPALSETELKLIE